MKDKGDIIACNLLCIIKITNRGHNYEGLLGSKAPVS